VLTINGGSSSIKYALFRKKSEEGLAPVFRGAVEKVGGDDDACATALWERLEQEPSFAEAAAIGHRVVHGMRHVEPELVSDELMRELREISPFVPDHLPREIHLIDLFRERRPSVPQVVCFDTAFHSEMPGVAKRLAIPRRLDAQGVRRYGFHGLSYAYLMQELARTGGAAAARGRVVLAHLGSGASLAAIRDGKSVDTSMGFTPASGLVMGTRTGDLDPGLVAFLARTEHMTAVQFDHMVNHASGLLGVSDTSADMRDLLERENADGRAAEAVALFCYQAKKWIGAFAAALGGLDTIVFSGGIGENAPLVRSRICEGLAFLGLDLDAAANAAGAPVISAPASRVAVRVIRTDEEVMIARSVARVLGGGA
jgi:acetate kinase